MIRTFLICLVAALFVGCSKTAFLAAKPSSQLVVPTSLPDLAAVLENTDVMMASPVLGEISADDYYMTDDSWNNLGYPEEQNTYLWAKDIFVNNTNIFDWRIPYQQVFYANVVLEGLANIPVTDANRAAWATARGSALFIRANAFYNLSQLFIPVYDSAMAGTDLGLPLKLSSDVTKTVQRSSVAATYQQVIRDMQEAANLLPPAFPGANRNRPTRAAALAMLSRIHLSMRAYHEAGLYADSCLQLYPTLLDYNTVNAAATYLFPNLCDENLYENAMAYNQTTVVMLALIFPGTVVDSTLYASYGNNDLRKTVFFKQGYTGDINVRPGYAGITTALFSGPATDEMYLNRAEANARSGNISAAMNDLNTLLKNRYVTGSFNAVTATTSSEALSIILQERRKELCFRGLRWTDLRRLNKEGAGITPKRVLNGTTYTLLPNSELYTLPIPPDEIIASGIQQNQR